MKIATVAASTNSINQINGNISGILCNVVGAIPNGIITAGLFQIGISKISTKGNETLVEKMDIRNLMDLPNDIGAIVEVNTTTTKSIIYIELGKGSVLKNGEQLKIDITTAAACTADVYALEALGYSTYQNKITQFTCKANQETEIPFCELVGFSRANLVRMTLTEAGTTVNYLPDEIDFLLNCQNETSLIATSNVAVPTQIYVGSIINDVMNVDGIDSVKMTFSTDTSVIVSQKISV